MHDAAMLLFVQSFRDWVIIVSGILIGAFFLVALLVTLVLGLLLRALLQKVSSLMDDSVRPLLDDNVKPLIGSVRDTAEHVKGTTSYVTRAAVTPIVRTYGVVAGVRRAVGVIAGFTGADNKPPRT